MEQTTEANAEYSSAEPTCDSESAVRSRRPMTSRFSIWKKKLHWRAFWLFPRWVPHAFGQDRDYERDCDKKANEETRVPEDQELRLRIVWGVELYGPAEIENLYAGLRKLGWKPVAQGRSIQDWVQHQRAFGYGGWLNIGRVGARSDRDGDPMTRNHSELPNGVTALVVRCHQITPSLTGLLIGFELDDSAARCYENELNRDRTTILKRDVEFSVLHWSPEHQKLESINEARAGFRRMIGEWFRQNVPGFFSALRRREAFPTMELMTAEKCAIFQDDKTPVGSSIGWRRIVSSSLPWDVWQCDDVPGLQLAMFQSRGDADGLHVEVALDRSKLVDDELKSWGGHCAHAVASRFNEELEGVLVHASTLRYLAEQSRDIKLTRVGLKRARSGSRSVVRTIREIGLYFDRSLGSPAIASELVKKSEAPNQYRRDFAKFSKPSRTERGALDLSDEMQTHVHHLALRLNEDETAMRAHIEQISSVLSVRESIRTQRRMEWLTIIAVVVAVVTLLAGLPSAARYLETLVLIWS